MHCFIPTKEYSVSLHDIVTALMKGEAIRNGVNNPLLYHVAKKEGLHIYSYNINGYDPEEPITSITRSRGPKDVSTIP